MRALCVGAYISVFHDGLSCGKQSNGGRGGGDCSIICINGSRLSRFVFVKMTAHSQRSCGLVPSRAWGVLLCFSCGVSFSLSGV